VRAIERVKHKHGCRGRFHSVLAGRCQSMLENREARHILSTLYRWEPQHAGNTESLRLDTGIGSDSAGGSPRRRHLGVPVMTHSRRHAAAAFIATITSVFAVGCGLGGSTSPLGSSSPVSPAITTTGLIQGQVHGGNSPIVGATVQLYAAGQSAALKPADCGVPAIVVIVPPLTLRIIWFP
jgi:hypothetical protein